MGKILGVKKANNWVRLFDFNVPAVPRWRYATLVLANLPPGKFRPADSGRVAQLAEQLTLNQ